MSMILYLETKFSQHGLFRVKHIDAIVTLSGTLILRGFPSHVDPFEQLCVLWLHATPPTNLTCAACAACAVVFLDRTTMQQTRSEVVYLVRQPGPEGQTERPFTCNLEDLDVS